MPEPITKSKRVLAFAACAIVAVAVFFAGKSTLGKKTEEETAPRPVPVNLNVTLTNEMSDTSALDGFDRQVKDYLTFWGIQGASLSVMRNDSLLFAKGYGKADNGKAMEPGNILRLASVSKLVTAVGIMLLQDNGHQGSGFRP